MWFKGDVYFKNKKLKRGALTELANLLAVHPTATMDAHFLSYLNVDEDSDEN